MASSKGANNRLLFAFTAFILIDITLALSPDESGSKSGILPDGSLNCETDRSSDYYGLGVRMGVYAAWLSAWIANCSVPSEIPTAHDTNAIFLFAILCSMIRCAISGTLFKLDGLMLMHMAGGTIFSVLSIWGYRTCVYELQGPKQGIKQFGGWGTHFRLLLSLGISTFGIYFWSTGVMGDLHYDPFPGCEVVYTFMFAKVRADGGIRIFYMIICIGCMLYFGSMVLMSLIALPPRLRREKEAWKKGDSGYRVRLQFVTGLNQRQLRQIFRFLRVGNFLFIVYSMLLCEFTLNYNNVAGVLGRNGRIGFPSQLIPTIVGVFQLCKVLWVRYVQWKAPPPNGHLTSTDRKKVRDGANKERTILGLHGADRKRLVKFYSPKSNASKEFATRRPDNEIDPLMDGTPTYLRLLVSWAPWLGVLRWWNPQYHDTDDDDDDDNKNKNNNYNDHDDDEEKNRRSSSDRDTDSPNPATRTNTWGSEATSLVGSPQSRKTWESDSSDGVAVDTTLPEIPKDVARFGSLKV